MKNKILNVVKNELIIIYTSWVLQSVLLVSVIILFDWNIFDWNEVVFCVTLTLPVLLLESLFNVPNMNDLFKNRVNIKMSNTQIFGLLLMVLNLEIVIGSVIAIVSIFYNMGYDKFISLFDNGLIYYYILLIFANGLVYGNKKKKKKKEKERK